MATDDRRLATDDRRLADPAVQAAAGSRSSVVGGRSDDFRAGFVATLPLWLGAAPFGVIYAVSALAAGLDWAQTLAMSLTVFAGASQFTAVGLFAAGASPFTIVLTTLIVNARHALLAAALTIGGALLLPGSLYLLLAGIVASGAGALLSHRRVAD
jgi:predicted branched-subunit amino acid permease